MKFLTFLVAMCCLSHSFSAENREKTIEKKLRSAKDAVVLYTLMRSGTNWTLASLQYLTHRRFLYLPKYPAGPEPGLWNRLELQLDFDKPPIYRTHFFGHMQFLDPEYNKAIMILRNYRELFFRGMESYKISYSKFNERLTRFVKYYVSYLNECERWPASRKYFYYYEDLLMHPEKIFPGLLEFIDESDERLDDYFANLETIKSKTLTSYISQHDFAGHSAQSGINLTVYSNRAKPKYVELLDNAIRRAAGEYLWNKYLKHYCTPISTQ